MIMTRLSDGVPGVEDLELAEPRREGRLAEKECTGSAPALVLGVDVLVPEG
jgi:hypothetical protein